jgi:ABC-type nickel/cobalt efflux system permease component RcnA
VKRLVLGLAAVAACLAPGVASAHPLGNFTINHYDRLEPAGDRVRVLHVLDMAEIPTFQLQPAIEADPRGYAEQIGQNLHLELDGLPAELTLDDERLTFPEGQGGLPTLRLEAVFSAPVASAATTRLDFRDDNDPTRIGWREIVAVPGSTGTRVEQASVPADDVTHALTVYPEDLLSSPLNVHEAHLAFVPGGPTGAQAPANTAQAGTEAAGLGAAGPVAQVPGTGATAALVAQAAGVGGTGGLARVGGPLADLARGADGLTPGFLLFALGAAVVLGAAHALQPGHGKTIVAAYLVGSRGTAWQALVLGATVTATHTAGVYALGLATIFLSQYVVPERLYPILEVVSGGLVLGLGGWLLVKRLLAVVQHRRLAHAHEHHDHAHEHAGGHDHGHDHDHGHGHGHAHAGATSWRGLLALGVSGGLLPCPEALMVLLITIAAHQVLFGLALIVAFSLGLAGVLVSFGLLLVYARGLFGRLDLHTGLVPRVLPVASALVIVVAGSLITAQALPQVV